MLQAYLLVDWRNLTDAACTRSCPQQPNHDFVKFDLVTLKTLWSQSAKATTQSCTCSVSVVERRSSGVSETYVPRLEGKGSPCIYVRKSKHHDRVNNSAFQHANAFTLWPSWHTGNCFTKCSRFNTAESLPADNSSEQPNNSPHTSTLFTPAIATSPAHLTGQTDLSELDCPTSYKSNYSIPEA